MALLHDYRLSPLNGGPPKRAVIFLHGVGDRGDGGLLEIGRIWQPSFPDCEFLCPDAPFPFDGAPPEFGGRQWYSLQSFTPEKIYAGTREAALHLNAYIDHILTTRGFTSRQLALVGFSQGTIMALYTAPRRTEPVTCIVAYSGLLTGGETLAAEKKCAPPVLLVHGMIDEVVPFAAMGAAAQGLKAAGIPVSTITCPSLGHSIDDVGLIEGLKFLQKYL